jgi:hypothetical protein
MDNVTKRIEEKVAYARAVVTASEIYASVPKDWVEAFEACVGESYALDPISDYEDRAKYALTQDALDALKVLCRKWCDYDLYADAVDSTPANLRKNLAKVEAMAQVALAIGAAKRAYKGLQSELDEFLSCVDDS